MKLKILETSILFAETILKASQNTPDIRRVTEDYLAEVKKYKKIIEQQAQAEGEKQEKMIKEMEKVIWKQAQKP